MFTRFVSSTTRIMSHTNITPQYNIVWVTVPNIEVGTTLAKGLVTEKLAACVNIIPQITSVFSWEGKIETDSENLLMIKTRHSLLPDLTDYVKKHHPYSVPEVISADITFGYQPYLDFIQENTK